MVAAQQPVHDGPQILGMEHMPPAVVEAVEQAPVGGSVQDTGWRDLQIYTLFPELLEGYDGLRVRRIGNTVFQSISINHPPEATYGWYFPFGTLAEGFRPDFYWNSALRVTLASDSSKDVDLWVVGDEGDFYLDSGRPGWALGQIVYPTNDPWPEVLPGVAFPS